MVTILLLFFILLVLSTPITDEIQRQVKIRNYISTKFSSIEKQKSFPLQFDYNKLKDALESKKRANFRSVREYYVSDINSEFLSNYKKEERHERYKKSCKEEYERLVKFN